MDVLDAESAFGVPLELLHGVTSKYAECAEDGDKKQNWECEPRVFVVEHHPAKLLECPQPEHKCDNGDECGEDAVRPHV